MLDAAPQVIAGLHVAAALPLSLLFDHHSLLEGRIGLDQGNGRVGLNHLNIVLFLRLASALPVNLFFVSLVQDYLEIAGDFCVACNLLTVCQGMVDLCGGGQACRGETHRIDGHRTRVASDILYLFVKRLVDVQVDLLMVVFIIALVDFG